jgi:signal peptidase II
MADFVMEPVTSGQPILYIFGDLLMKMKIKLLLVGLVLLGGCQSDLITKHLAEETLKNQPAYPVVTGYLDLRYTENFAMSFSMFEDLPAAIRRPVLTAAQLLSTLLVTVLLFASRKKSFFTLLPLLFILCGAFGNAWDRLRYGYVVDFIHFHIQNKFSWPIFNVADILIAVGVGLFLLQTFMNRGETLLPQFQKTGPDN